jgi:predicted metal-dependent hydrolase
MTRTDRRVTTRIRVEHEGLDLACDLVPNPRNRHLRLRLLSLGDGPAALHRTDHAPGVRLLPGFDPNPGLVLRVSYPPRFSRRTVLETVRGHWRWVSAQVARTRAQPPAPGRGPLITGARLWFRGSKLTLYVLPHSRRRTRWVLQNERLLCYTSRPGQADLRRDLEAWYRRRAQELIGERLRALAPGISSRPHRWRLRAQKSRWGSCSAGQGLNFNWKLVMMPDFALNYVVIHELAHLEVLDHSKRFWQLVGRHCPYADTARTWLRRHGAELEW